MKAKTLQIIWHSKDPVFSIDFHPDGYIATGGGDKDIKLWEMCCDADGNPHVRYVSSLSGHSRTINCVRFSHSGHCLASAGDSGELLVWKPLPGSTQPQPPAASASAFGTPGPHRDSTTAAAGNSLSPGSPDKPSAAAAAEEGPAAAAGAAAGAAGWAQVGAWKLSATLRGHHDDVTDLAWAHDDAVIMSGSVENEVMMFDVDTRKTLARLEGHRHYVQGVAWDPLGAWMVSCSADRTVRVHGLKPPPSGSKAAAAAAAREGMRPSTVLARDVLHTHTLSKVAVQPPATPPQAGAAAAASGEQGAPAADAQQQQQQQPVKPLQAPLFHDESLNTFFRRLAWSPEGSLLAVPAGLHREVAGQQPQHATYIYARGHWGCPLLALPCPSKASTVVRFCPRIFKLKQQQQQQQEEQGSDGAGSGGQQAPAAAGAGAAVGGGCENVLGLPYRLVLAVATMDSVLLYDMQTCEPLMLVGPLHYAPITDLAWSRDGSCLAVSSHDGYCSMVTFKPGELGQPVDLDQQGPDGQPDLPAGLQAALAKVQAAAAATAAKAGVGAAAGGAATPISPKLVGVGVGASGTPRPASAAAGAAAAASTPQTGGQQRKQQVVVQKPRRVQPEAVPPAAASTVAAAGSRPASAAPAASSAAAPAPRRVTSQPVPAGQASPAAPAFSTASPAPAASAAAAGATPGPGPIGQQQQQQQVASRAASAAASPAASAAPAALAAGGGGAGRVGLAAVQAALAAAAAKKRAAAKMAAEAAPGVGGGTDGDEVVIVGEVAGEGAANKRAKLS